MLVKQVRAALVIVGSLLFLVGCAVEQDKEEARLIAARVHAELRTGDFGSIYSESAPRFKTVGNELQFVERMKAFQEQFGQLNSASEVSYQARLDSTVGRTTVLVFELTYDRGHARESLVFVRSPEGRMQLWKLDLQPAD